MIHIVGRLICGNAGKFVMVLFLIWAFLMNLKGIGGNSKGFDDLYRRLFDLW